jgi:hypothetical protein
VRASTASVQKVSKARNQLKRLDAPVNADAEAFLTSLPRRYEAMSLEALEALLDAIRSETERRLGRSKIADPSATAPAWAATMAKRAAAGEVRLVLSLQAELRRKSGRAA